MVDGNHIMRIYTAFSAACLFTTFFWFSFTVIAQTIELNEQRVTRAEKRVEQHGDRLAKLETNIAVLTAYHQQVEKKLNELETLLTTIGAMVGAIAVNVLAGLVRIAVKHYLPRHGDPK